MKLLSKTQVEQILQQAQKLQEAYKQTPSLQGRTDDAKAARIQHCQEQFAFAWQGDIASLPEEVLIQQVMMLMLTVAFVQRERAELQTLPEIRAKFIREFNEELPEALEVGRWGVLGEESGDCCYYIHAGCFVSQHLQLPLDHWLERAQELVDIVEPYGLTWLDLVRAMVAKFRLRALLPKTDENKEREREAVCAVWRVDPGATFSR